MRLLLDTHTLLWFLADDRKLSPAAKAVLTDPRSERLLLPISLLEIALKVRLGKLSLSAPFGVLFPAQLSLNRIALLRMTDCCRVLGVAEVLGDWDEQNRSEWPYELSGRHNYVR